MRIYLDHNATTPLDPLVADRMALAMREVWGNASSVHHFGQQAKAALDEARGAGHIIIPMRDGSRVDVAAVVAS